MPRARTITLSPGLSCSASRASLGITIWFLEDNVASAMLYIIAGSKADSAEQYNDFARDVQSSPCELGHAIMEQKPSSEILPLDFPVELAAKAYVHSGEAAWRPQFALAAIEWLCTHGYAVLGTEVFLFKQYGIQSLPYFQSVDPKGNEDWNSYVTRAAAETIAYLKAFEQKLQEEGDVYINVTWVSEPEFRNLKLK